MATLAALIVGKLVIWWIALGSGTSGGTLAPILLISSCFGALTGEVLARAFPGLGLAPSTFALVAMAATFGAAARAPFAAIIFIFELTRDYNAILPLMLATVLADLLARTILPNSIMTEKLARRGVTVPGAFHADPLRNTTVRSVMSRDVATLRSASDLAAARAFIEEAGHRALPVVDEDGHLVGIVSRGDVGDLDVESSGPVLDAATTEVVTASPDETLFVALSRIVEEGVDHLPVVDRGRLVGICTRSDILQARIRQLDHEQVEQGRISRRRVATR